MRKYNDKELNRLLSESDELLADLNINLYETPKEEQARKSKEERQHQLEEERKQEEQHRLEEKHRLEEQCRLEEKREQEELAEQQEEELRRIREEERRKQRMVHREEIEQALFEAAVTEEEDKVEAVVKKDEAMLGAAAEKDEAMLGTAAEKDEAMLGAVAEKDEAMLGTAVEKDEAMLGAVTEKHEAMLEAVTEKDEAVLEAVTAKEKKSSEAMRVKDEDSIEGVDRKKQQLEAVSQQQVSTPEDEQRIEPKQQGKQLPISNQRTNKTYSIAASVLFMMLSFMFMEAMTHIGVYGILGSNFIYPLFFAASLGSVICLLSGFLNVKGNTIVACLLLILFAAYCDLQLIYHAAMGSYLRLSQARDDMWLLLHSEQIKEATAEVLPWLVLMLLPVMFWAVIGRKFIQFQRSHGLTKLVFLIGTVIFAVIGVMMLDLKGYEDYSPYAAFYNYESGIRAEQAGNQLGMTALTGLEILELFR